MNRDTAVELVEFRLGNREGTYTSQIIKEMKAAQSFVESRPLLPWFLLVQEESLFTTASTSTVALPSTTPTNSVRGGFLLEDEYSRMFIDDGSEVFTRVEKGDYDTLRGFSALTGTGKPERYAVQGTDLHFFPQPDNRYELDFFYYQQDKILSSNIENEWLKRAPEVLITQTIMQMFSYLKPAEQQAKAIGEADRALKIMDDRDEARRQAALDNVLGG